ncbi:MAG: hypothetical protein M1829_001899 [Trizodia sp. TS-e1964]|nr:MAG: hypothetical protein M1829_001899 [Trizodia sp. TS-e1964]
MSLEPSPHKLNLAQLPAIYILPAHLTPLELNNLVDQISKHGGRLTADIDAAKLVLGKVTTKRRAEFELRCRRLWTQDVDRIDSREGENQDLKSNKRPRFEGTSLTLDGKGVIAIDDTDSNPFPIKEVSCQTLCESTNAVKVVNISWLEDSLQSRRLLPADRYLVYQGSPIQRPAFDATPSSHSKSSASSPNSAPTLPSTPLSRGEGIIGRAHADANPSSWSSSRRKIKPFSRNRNISSQAVGKQAKRPALLHQTTSEHDDLGSNPLPPMPEWVLEGKKYSCERSTPSPSPNEAFIEQLSKIKLARILNLDDIGVRAYSTSIASLLAYPRALSSTQEVLALPGCHTKISHLFHEWKTSSGHIQEVEELENDKRHQALAQFYEIWGVGAKTAVEFYDKNGWHDLDDIIEFGWGSLHRIQQVGLKFYEDFQLKIPRTEAERIADIVLSHAQKARDSGMICCIAGGYRRGKEENGDVDLILSHPDEHQTSNLIEDLVRSLEAEGWITHTLVLALTNSRREQQTLEFRIGGGGHGFDSLDKALVVWRDVTKEGSLPIDSASSNSNPHRRVDIIISPWRTVGCAIIGWSGGTTFQRDLRRYAKNVHGWKFDSSGVRDRATGRVVDLEGEGGVCASWQEAERKVFAGFGLQYREPWERCTW